jgi:hypothetical protein
LLYPFHSRPSRALLLSVLVLTYLGLVQLFKRRFYRVGSWQATA